MPYLEVVKGPNPGQRFELNRDKLVIGRNPDCDVVIPNGAVSREHAEVLRTNGSFFLKDLRSRNRTKLNDGFLDPNQPPVRLRDKDQVQICDFVCVYFDGDEGEELEPGASTVMSTVEPGAASSHIIIESQPAEKLRILLELTNTLTRTLDIESLLPMIIDSLFDIFRQADRGFLILRDEAGRRLIPKAIKCRREKDQDTARFSRTIVNRVMETGQSILSEDAMSDSNLPLSQSISDFRIRSMMCAPLRTADGKVFGVIQLDTQDRMKRFVADDLKLLVAVANQAAVAMENAKLHEEEKLRASLERELNIARQVQMSFLPAETPVLPGYDFHAFYQPAREVGGDFYSFVNLPGQRLAVCIGDVAGKGVPAALLMARLTTQVRFCLAEDADPAVAVTRLNQLLQETNLADRFVTFLLLVLDSQAHQICVVNAGHLVPIIRRAAGRLEDIGTGELTGFPLGVSETFEYKSGLAALQPGDSVLLYTDGIIDAMSPDGDGFGTEQLRSTVTGGPPGVELLCKHVLSTVQRHVADTSQHDDMTLVALGRRP